MKLRLAIVAMLCVGAASLSAETAFSVHLGTNLFRYEQAYLITGVTVVSDLADQMEFNVGADFGIATQDTGEGTIQPQFLIPVELGLNFTFPSDPLTFYVGVGLVPYFQISPGISDSFRFYMGPYAKSGLRVKVHAVMSAFLDVGQHLVFGGPTWINTTTKLSAGIHFSFP